MGRIFFYFIIFGIFSIKPCCGPHLFVCVVFFFFTVILLYYVYVASELVKLLRSAIRDTDENKEKKLIKALLSFI